MYINHMVHTVTGGGGSKRANDEDDIQDDDSQQEESQKLDSKKAKLDESNDSWTIFCLYLQLFYIFCLHFIPACHRLIYSFVTSECIKLYIL